jgi:hypothetical protein
MSKYDDFELVLSDFNKVEERMFLNNVREFAEGNQEVVVKTFDRLLKTKDLNLQLKYLVFRSIGELKYKEFIPIIKEALYAEDKVRLIIEAVNSLTAMTSLPAFKVAVDYIREHKDAEYAENLEKNVRAVFSKNQLLYHFDLFYRKRGDVSGLEKSSEYLVEHLPEDYVKDILPALTSRHHKVRFETLRILAQRPNPIYYNNIYHYFMDHYKMADESIFLMMSEALVKNASVSKAKTRIFKKLKELVPQLRGDKRVIFCIALLKLNTRELIHFIAGVYPKLNFERKILVLTNLRPEDYVHYMQFIKELLVEEHNEAILARIVESLARANDFQYLFDTLDRGNAIRKEKTLNIILDHVEREPAEIDNYIRAYVTPTQENKILHLAIEYLLKHTADHDFELIKSIFFSGVAFDIKILIIRNINRFDRYHQKLFIESIFKDLTVISAFKKDFLFSLLGVMNEKVFEEELEENILHQVLVMMEEAHFEDIVNFIYFFDRYEINNPQDCRLIIDEFRLIQNTLLKSIDDNNLVKMIHVLIRRIEKKMTLKK